MNLIINVFLFVFVILFKLVYFIYYPILMLQAKKLKLKELKINICNLLNKIHCNAVFHPDNFGIRLKLFTGFAFYHKETKKELLSCDYNKDLLNMNDIDFKDIQLFNNSSDPDVITDILNYKEVRFHFDISFNKNNINSLHFQLLFHPIYELGVHKVVHILEFPQSSIGFQIKLDIDLNIVSFEKEYYEKPVSPYVRGNYTCSKYTPMSLNEEFSLVLLEIQSSHPDVYHLIPEIHTPSAYDFNSEDFNGRLLLAKMLSI